MTRVLLSHTLIVSFTEPLQGERKRMNGRRWLLLGTALLLMIAATAVGAHPSPQPDTPTMTELTDADVELLGEIRRSTADFYSLDAAIEAGYAPLLDCMSHDEMGGMGQHYANGDFAGDDVVDALRPEALVYEPQADGDMILVALEYVVFTSVWDPDDEGREPPTLMGQTFQLKENVGDLPPFYALHIWLWNYNPSGVFADYNPTVACPAATSAQSRFI
jgi:hypothetical protein